MPKKRFAQQKKFALKRLSQDRKEGKVDEGIFPLLNFFNSQESFYTTSSCSGRIVLFQDVGNKRDSSFIGKWHRKVEFSEVREKLKKLPAEGIIWLRCEPSILHVVAKNLEGARKLLRLSLATGYKRSGIRGFKEDRYLVEICSTERIETPLGEKGTLFVSEDYLDYLTKIANKKFQKSQQRLKKLGQILREKLK